MVFNVGNCIILLLEQVWTCQICQLHNWSAFFYLRDIDLSLWTLFACFCLEVEERSWLFAAYAWSFSRGEWSGSLTILNILSTLNQLLLLVYAFNRCFSRFKEIWTGQVSKKSKACTFIFCESLSLWAVLTLFSLQIEVRLIFRTANTTWINSVWSGSFARINDISLL